MRDAIGLVDASQQPIGLAAVVEDVCPPGQGPTDVERMPQPARISILLIAQLRGLVRVAAHPERLRREDAGRRSDIIPCQLPPSLGALRVVEGENLVALRQRLVQLTEVEAGTQAGAVPKDLQVDVPALVSLREQASEPSREILPSGLA